MRLPRPSATFVIAVLALLLAAGGGAFAAVTVTGSAVNIVDPAVSTRIAHVDSNGHLVVAGALAPAVPKSPFWRATYATKPADGGRLLIEPTAATLAVTR